MRKKLKGNMVECDAPLFITLANAPANRSPFRVVRSDGLDKFASKLRGNTTVARADALVSVSIDDDANEEDIASLISVYGLSDDLFESGKSDGRITYTRRDDDNAGLPTEVIAMKDSVEVTVAIRADDKKTPAKKSTAKQAVRSEVEETELPAVTTDEVEHIQLARIRFDPESFTTDQALEWAQEQGLEGFTTAKRTDVIALTNDLLTIDNEIDFTSSVPTAGIILDGIPVDSTKRADAYEAVMMTNDHGVIPFGSYGWNQDNFLAAIADKEYSEKFSMASDLLLETLRNIMMWQWRLTPSEAKILMESSLDGAKWYFGNLLDALPQNAVQRSDLKHEDNNMALTIEDKKDIAELVNTQIQQRADADKVEAQKRAEADALKAESDAEATKRSDNEAKLLARIEELETKANLNSTETRSDSEDPTIVDSVSVDDKTAAKTKTATKRSDEEIFSGLFSGVEGAE